MKIPIVRGWMVLTMLLGGGSPISEAVELTRGPYLQNGSKTAVAVRWRTLEETDSVVWYGTSATNLNVRVDLPEATTEHEISITNLMPNTRYYYSIGTSDEVLATGSDCFFLTSPDKPKATRIWVLGDSGTADENAAAVRDIYYSFTGTRHTDLWLMLGDNAYGSGTDSEYQRAVFDMYPEMLRKSVLWPTIGNHETYADFPYPNIFTLPTAGEAGGVASGTENYYSFDYGNIHFVCLDSMKQWPGAEAMRQWLTADLEENTNEWLIAFWHHPPYSKGSHNSDGEYELIRMREDILPILESHGVDLVLSGHSHGYERSKLLNGHYGFSGSLEPGMILDDKSGRAEETGAYVKPVVGPGGNAGAVYVVAGSSGLITWGPLNHPVMFVSHLRLGSLVLDVDGGQLDAQFLQADGVIGDNFTILKGARAPMQIIAYNFATKSVSVTWNSVAQKRYQVEFQDKVADPQGWTPVSGVITASSGRTTWTGAPRGTTNGFYRVVNHP